MSLDNGTTQLECNCNSSNYKYEACGHIVTGDSNIIKDVKLRNSIEKSPTCREQNNIDWEVNRRNCKEAVTKYMGKWARAAGADRGVFRDWEKTVHECIDERVRFLKQRRFNKRKKQVLRNKVHLDSLNSLYEKYVLVPADKAANNVIVVCKKYYLDVVIKKLNSTI